MENKPLTHKELFQIPEDDISREDKDLIEKSVLETGGSHDDGPDIPVRCAIRGYLAKEWTDLEPDDELRKDCGDMAASFSDGWNWALQFERPDKLPELRKR